MSTGEMVETRKVDHSQATIIFVLGLLGLVLCQVMGPIAFYMGHKYRNECIAAGEEMEGLGTAGWILGIIGTIILIILLMVILLYALFVLCMVVFYVFMLLMVFLTVLLA